MANQPNIPFQPFVRLSIDDTAPVLIRFWSESTPIDITGKEFRIVLYSAAGSIVLTLNNGDIIRPSGQTGLLQWNSDVNRNVLAVGTSYTGYLFEIIDSKQEPRMWFTFQFTTTPPAYVAGLPLEPAEVALNYGGIPPVASGVNVFGIVPATPTTSGYVTLGDPNYTNNLEEWGGDIEDDWNTVVTMGILTRLATRAFIEIDTVNEAARIQPYATLAALKASAQTSGFATAPIGGIPALFWLNPDTPNLLYTLTGSEPIART